MKIAYLISQYPTINHTYILAEVRALRGQGIEVEVISLKAPDRPAEMLHPQEREEAASTWYVQSAAPVSLALAQATAFFQSPGRYLAALVFALRMSRFTPAELPRWIWFFLQAVMVGRRLSRRGLSQMHVHYASSVGLLVARLLPVRVSHTIHGSAEFLDATLFRLREKVRYADFIVAISRFGRSQVMLFSDPADWDRVEVCPLGIDPDQFPPVLRRRPPGEPFQLLAIGQLAAAKGLPVLLKAVARLARRGRRVILSLIGDGPLRATLEAQAASLGIPSQVRFEGFRNNADLPLYFAQTDAVVMPSFAEGVPVVLMEAMASGLPCIASRITGIPELIEDGVSGLLTVPADEEDIATAIERLMDDGELCRRLGEAARTTVLERYNLYTNTARLAGIFASRAGAGKGPKTGVMSY